MTAEGLVSFCLVEGEVGTLTVLTAETSQAGASEPMVYRYFLNSDQFLKYARGTWKGLGLHGSTEIDPATMVHMQLRVSQGNIEVRLRRAPPRTSGLIYRLGRLLDGLGAKARHAPRIRHVPQRELQDSPGFAAGDVHAGDEPDLVQLRMASWSMTCQALTDERLHVVLYRDRQPDSLVFSGTLTRA